MYGVTDHLQPTLRIYLSLERMDHCVHHVAIFVFLYHFLFNILECPFVSAFDQQCVTFRQLP